MIVNSMENLTSADRFILLGLTSTPYLQELCVLLILIMYIVTIAGNLLLIIVVGTSVQLQTPMYFFLCNLSVIDICFSSTIVPKLLINTLAHDKSISLFGCASQMFFHLALGCTECMILAAMAYDRYAAICKPLHYYQVMNKRVCICLASGSWAVSLINSAIHVVFTFQLPFCRSNHLNHFFCEIPPFLYISCRDTWFNEVATYISASIIGIGSLSLTLISYVYIVLTILNMCSAEGKMKAFSTCASHLTVVLLYFFTIFFMYLHPHSDYYPETSKMVSLIYTVVTPMLNPIIYSIRNVEVKSSIKNKLTIETFKKF
ncbi:olfactory receptor 5B21-like [Xenopus tropicalis]|uniref:Olfactory receptor n=1 Tax=Xenopus tropicalis TaxID=8364 RepID=A0A8J0R2N2_XENTR|nr:olfactory receptor 5B21-like [Xenopus tropicalis]